MTNPWERKLGIPIKDGDRKILDKRITPADEHQTPKAETIECKYCKLPITLVKKGHTNRCPNCGIVLYAENPIPIGPSSNH